MDNLIKYGAIAVGGYFVAKYLGYDLLNLAPGSSAQVATSPQAGSSPTNANTVAVMNTTKSLVFAAMSKSNQPPTGVYTVDTWNYFYKAARGVSNAPAPEGLFPNNDRNRLYSWDEYWSAMSSQGFSGLGTIAHHVNPYANNQRTPFGSNAVPNGMEKYIFRMG